MLSKIFDWIMRKLFGDVIDDLHANDNHYMGVPMNKTPQKPNPVKHERVGDYCNGCGKHIAECPKLKNNQ